MKGAEAQKKVFELVNRLHEAGYPAEVHLGGPAPADLRWNIDVQGKAPSYVLTDWISQRRFEAETAIGVLALLGRRKRSPSKKVRGRDRVATKNSLA